MEEEEEVRRRGKKRRGGRVVNSFQGKKIIFIFIATRVDWLVGWLVPQCEEQIKVIQGRATQEGRARL